MTHTLPADRLPAPDAAACTHKTAFEMLASCHEHIGERLDVLAAAGRELADGAALDDRLLARLGDALVFLDVVIPIHSADEEESLFPRLRERPPFAGVAGTPMDCMEDEHLQHAALKARLKVAIVQRDATAAGRAALAIVSEYRSHIEKEDGILFPMAREVLTDPGTLDTMQQEMVARRREAGLLAC